MTRKDKTDPAVHRVTLDITDEIIDRASRADSGGCVIADAIKSQIPNASSVSVDLATIRFSDKAAGKRYVYLTPDTAQLCVFAFDRGLRPTAQKLTLYRPIQITNIKAGSVKSAKNRQIRLATLETKEAAGALTGRERSSLTRLRETPERPTSQGPRSVNEAGTLIGGRPLPTTPGATPAEREGKRGAIPELLPTRARVFGARKANASKLDDLLDEAMERGRQQGKQAKP